MKYNFDINNRAFNAIKNKTKRVEIRTTKLGENHFDYSILKSGDEIEFKSYDGEIINCLVGDVNHYDSIEKLLELEKENIKFLERQSKIGLNNVINFRKHYYYSFFKYINRRIWLFMDRPDVADDNAEHLFKYAVRQNDDIEKYFILNRNSRDFKRLGKIGNVVPTGSEEHKLLACHAEKIISSQADAIVINPFYDNEKYCNGLFSAKAYFLQHGVIKEDISSWLHRYDKYLYMILTSAATTEYQPLPLSESWVYIIILICLREI